MTISSAYIFAKQIKAGTVPLDVVWFNSRNASPMQNFGDNGNPYIKIDSGAVGIRFVKRNNSSYPSPAAGFIGIQATEAPLDKLPWSLTIPLVDANDDPTIYSIKYEAEATWDEWSTTVTVFCRFMEGDTEITSRWGSVDAMATDESVKFYLFTGAGAFLNNRAGSELIYNTTYIGCIVDKIVSDKRYVDVAGAPFNLNDLSRYGGIKLPSNRLT